MELQKWVCQKVAPLGTMDEGRVGFHVWDQPSLRHTLGLTAALGLEPKGGRAPGRPAACRARLSWVEFLWLSLHKKRQTFSTSKHFCVPGTRNANLKPETLLNTCFLGGLCLDKYVMGGVSMMQVLYSGIQFSGFRCRDFCVMYGWVYHMVEHVALGYPFGTGGGSKKRPRKEGQRRSIPMEKANDTIDFLLA